MSVEEATKHIAGMLDDGNSRTDSIKYARKLLIIAGCKEVDDILIEAIEVIDSMDDDGNVKVIDAIGTMSDEELISLNNDLGGDLAMLIEEDSEEILNEGDLARISGLSDFSKRVLSSARDMQVKKIGENALILSIWEHESQDMGLQEFKENLAKSAENGYIQLSRGGAGLNEDESKGEIRCLGENFHLVRLP